MKPQILGQGLHPLHPPFATSGKFVFRSWNRHASSSPLSSPSEPAPPKRRIWVRLAFVSVAAAGIGAYIRKSQQDGPSTLNPLAFTKYTLIAKEPVSSTGSIFTLKPPRPDGNSDVYEAAWQTGVWSVMFKQPQLQIGRDYTPLPMTSTTGNQEDDGVLRFFIRKGAFGEMSRYLHNLGLGSVVEMRGPKIECKIPKQTQDILFIAGGTGIAPALQASHTLLRRTDETHKPRIHILWANRRREDCAGGMNDTIAKPQGARSFWFFGPSTSPASSDPVAGNAQDTNAQSLVVRELEALKSQFPGQVTVHYFVDEEKTFIKKENILDFTNSTRPPSGSPRAKMILVSGPEGFISYMAGPKLWAQGTEVQGPLRGIISELDLKDWATWKL